MWMCDVQQGTFAFVIFQIKTSDNSIDVAKSCSAVMSLPDHAALSTASLAAHRLHWVVLPFHLGLKLNEEQVMFWRLWSTAAETVRRPPQL